MADPLTPLLVHIRGNGWFALVAELRSREDYGDVGRLGVYEWNPQWVPREWPSEDWGSHAIGSVYPGPSWSAEARLPGTLRHGFAAGEQAVAYIVDCWGAERGLSNPFGNLEPRA